MSGNRRCPRCENWASEFDPYFRRWRCYWPGCWWMPRSSVEAWKDVHGNPRYGGPLPRGSVMSAAELVVGAEYEFMAEAERGRWVRLAVRTFAGAVEAYTQDDESTLADDAVSTGARFEFTHHATVSGGPGRFDDGSVVAFWDGGMRDGYISTGRLLGDGATIAVVPVSAGGGTRRRTDDNLRGVFG